MMEDKRQEIQRVMKQEGLDVLILHHPEELVMAFDYYPFWGQSFGLIFQKEEPLLFIPKHEPLHEEKPSDVEVINETRVEQTIELLQDYQSLHQISELVIGGSLFPKNTSIPGNGAESGSLGSGWWENLIQTTNFQVQDVKEVLEKLSFKKSKTAIDNIKIVHQISEVGLETFYQELKPGNTELALSLAIEKRIKFAGMQAGMNFVLCYAQIQAGRETLHSGTYNRTTLNSLEEQDFVVLELAVCMDGYWLDLTRTGVVGKPTKEQLWHYEQINEAQRQVVEMMRPGIFLQDLYQQSKARLDKVNLGKYYPHGLGHSVGYQYHDPGLAIQSGNEQALEVGMIVTIEPGIYGTAMNGGMRIEDNLLVTETGVEWLSKGLRGLTGEPYLEKGEYTHVEK